VATVQSVVHLLFTSVQAQMEREYSHMTGFWNLQNVKACVLVIILELCLSQFISHITYLLICFLADGQTKNWHTSMHTSRSCTMFGMVIMSKQMSCEKKSMLHLLFLQALSVSYLADDFCLVTPFSWQLCTSCQSDAVQLRWWCSWHSSLEQCIDRPQIAGLL